MQWGATIGGAKGRAGNCKLIPLLITQMDRPDNSLAGVGERENAGVGRGDSLLEASTRMSRTWSPLATWWVTADVFALFLYMHIYGCLGQHSFSIGKRWHWSKKILLWQINCMNDVVAFFIRSIGNNLLMIVKVYNFHTKSTVKR